MSLIFCATSAADFYQGIRQMGMGGAAVAVVNDETALLLNPIGLGRLREPYVTIIDPEITTNMDSVSVVQGLAFDSVEIDKVYDELGGRLDTDYFARAQFFPSFATRNYGIGFLGKYDVLAKRRSVDQFLELQYTSDWAAVAGYNHSFFGGQVKVGISGRYIDRVEFAGAIDPTTQGLELKNLAVNGTALAADIGLSLTSPTDWLPTISVLMKDVGDTSFTMGKGMRDSYLGLGDPSKIPMTVDVAAALFPIWSNSSRGTITVEYDDVLGDGDTEKRLHAGLEINLADRFFFRGGWNKGYFTSGFEFATSSFQLQLAYYGEEIGTDDNPVQDDRLAIKTVFRF
ncbi:MAG: hypothetical protein IT287_01535 [Bdellovibrionaceae bacterium]|nr:hypothetical protein [Pseudobdellovibrionaceae bacterium]